MKPEFRKLIATVAPGLATALGGPLAGIATRAIAGKLLGKDAAEITDPAQLEAALGGMSGSDMVKLKEAELAFQREMKEAGVEMERVAAQDRDSARQRQVNMKDWTPSILGAVILVGFFAILAYLFKFGMPESSVEVLLLMLGALSTLVSQVANYFFGSSVGSKNKDRMIADLKGGVQ